MYKYLLMTNVQALMYDEEAFHRDCDVCKGYMPLGLSRYTHRQLYIDDM